MPVKPGAHSESEFLGEGGKLSLGSVMRLLLLSSLSILSTLPLPAGGEEIKPGKTIDTSKLAFYPKRWKQQGHALEMVPWEGKQIVFLTIGDAHDPKVMTALVDSLDKGWELYADVTGQKPKTFKAVNGKVTIAAVPNGMTCGYGCGYIGSTGIEMTDFYRGHLPKLKKNPKAVPHAYFYEMGRNYFTFGNRHNCFTTGFAVFMRYVCTDGLKLDDTDRGTRRIIDQAIAQYENSDLPFLRTFTNVHGLTEKQNRLKTSPTDQPVMYASAMLKLQRELGDAWLKDFFRQLASCPPANPKSKDGAQAQCFHWYLAASCAAKKNLAPTFLKKWRLALTPAQEVVLKDIDWANPKLEAGTLAKAVGTKK